MKWSNQSIVILVLSFIGYLNGQEMWNYYWKCINIDKCVRQHVDNKWINNITLYESQNACRLTCGEYGALWPKPTGKTLLGRRIIKINPSNIKFVLPDLPSVTQRLLYGFTDIFQQNIWKECHNECTLVSDHAIVIRIVANSTVSTLSWTTDESYQLDVATNDSLTFVTINAQTIFGIRHGLETLLQLIAVTNGATTSNGNELVMVDFAKIEDRPIFAYRGLMIDTSRHFMPINVLKRNLDGMSASKLNVFHWHITDSHSFPMDIPSMPQFTRYGAYSPNEIYSQSDIQELISYALLRGIRVIMELDAPAHSGNGWQWGPQFNMGDLALCVNQQPWRSYCIQPPCGQLNPININLYSVIKNIYKYLLNVLPSGETIHMGGDEVFFACWNSSSEIVNYLKENGRGREDEDFLQLWADYHKAALNVWDELTTKISKTANPANQVIIWSSHLTKLEHIEKYLDKERYIIQAWVPSTDDLPLKLISKGYNVIISVHNAWYLDHGFHEGIAYPYYTWRTAYKNRIPKVNGVLGGEACVWTELINRNTLDSRIWPRAAAVAERLWADPEFDADIAEPRFLRHNDRLAIRGLNPEAFTPQWCEQNEGECIKEY